MEEEELIFVKDLLGREDIMFGEGEVQQVRDGELVLITRINAHSIPYRKATGELVTVGAALDELFARGSET